MELSKQPPRVLAMVGETGEMDGCYMWRVFQPMAELNRQGFNSAGWDYFDNPLVEAFWQTYDAIVLPRMSWEVEDETNESRWFNLMREAGKAVIYEVDDDLFTDAIIERLVDWHNKTPAEAAALRERVTRALQRCDGVTCSSEYLRAVIEQLTDKPVMVVPNFIDLRWFRQMKADNRRWVKGLTIGWAGGIRPDADVNQMAVAWGRIADRFPQVQFVLQGHQPAVIHDAVPEERMHALPWMPVTEYPAGMLNIDIGCCPLDHTPFNRSKTFIKAMEYGALGAVVVASPTLYSQLIDHGRDGYICETADEWEAALADLVESANRRKRMAQNLERKLEQHYSLEGNAWRWLAAWEEVLSDFRRRQTQVYLPAGVKYEKRITA